MEKPPISQPRATKRFALQGPGTCLVHTNESIQIELIDISATGIQFSSKNSIMHDEKPVWLTWTDEQLGNLKVGVMVVRKSEVLDHNESKFSYGSQYCNLNEQGKTQLVALLKRLKEKQKQNLSREAETITPKFIFDVISKGKGFLKESFITPSTQLKSIIGEIKDYEKEFFKTEDAASIYIQDIVTAVFHLKLLGLMIPMIGDNPLHKTQFFNQTVDTLDNITAAESKQDTAMAGASPETPNLRQQIIESSNRLFYEKHKFLQATVDTFVMFEDPENTELFAQIKNEYERVVEVTTQNLEPSQQVYARKTKIIEKTREELIQEISINTNKKTSGWIWFNAFILIALAIGFLINSILDSQDYSTISEQLQLPIEIKEFKKMGSQIDITLGKDEWSKYPDAQKEIVYEKVIEYLKNEKRLEFALIFTDDLALIRMLNERTNLHPSKPAQDSQQVSTEAVPEAKIDPAPTQ